jgi:Fe-S-cluster containining protein
VSCFDCKSIHPKCKARCCGVVPVDRYVYNRYKNKRNRKVLNVIKIGKDVIPLTEDKTCTFLQKDLSCGIYDNRHRLCRDYGTEIDPLMTCKFQDKNGRRRGFFERFFTHIKIKIELVSALKRMKI